MNPIAHESEVARLFNCTDAEYHADDESISHSQAEVFRVDPALFHARFIARRHSREPTKAMAFGSLVHNCLLRPKFWSTDVTVIPPNALNGSGQRRGTAWTRFARENAGKPIVTEDEFETLRQIIDAVMEHAAAAALRTSIERYECPAKWVHPSVPIRLRCKFDGLCSNGIIVDLKTTRDARPREFTSAVVRYGYHRQAAWYSHGYQAVFGAPPRTFVFIAVTVESPVRVECYELASEFLGLGEQQNHETLTRIAEAFERGTWKPESHGQILTLAAPTWAASQEWEIEDGDVE